MSRKGKPPIQLIQLPQTKLTPNRTNSLPQLLMAYKIHPDQKIRNQLLAGTQQTEVGT